MKRKQSPHVCKSFCVWGHERAKTGPREGQGMDTDSHCLHSGSLRTEKRYMWIAMMTTLEATSQPQSCAKNTGGHTIDAMAELGHKHVAGTCVTKCSATMSKNTTNASDFEQCQLKCESTDRYFQFQTYVNDFVCGAVRGQGMDRDPHCLLFRNLRT